MNKRVSFLFLALLSMLKSYSQTFEYNGIFYNVLSADDKTVEVTSGGNYIGDIIIPAKVSFNNFEYSVTTIGKKAFYGSKNLSSIIIPESVTSILYSAFSGCSSLSSIEIPNSVTEIESSVFSTSGLTSIQFPDNLTKISDYLFYGCKELTAITIPNTVTTIGRSVFYGCISLTAIEIPGSVNSFGIEVLYGCSNLTSVKINYGVKYISSCAFSKCTKLSSIEIPNSVISIAGDAFANTKWYDNQPNGLVYAGKVVYKYKGSMPKDTNVQLLEGTTGIASNAFSGCANMTSIEIPNSVERIGFHAFYGCTGLTSVEIPNSVVSLSSAFDGCTGLLSLIVNSKEIGEASFIGLSSIRNLTIGNDVTSIGNSAFANCEGLISVKIPDSVTSIGDGAFGACTGLTSMNLGSNVTYIGRSAFRECINLISIEIPNKVITIGDWAFYGCINLNSVSFLGSEPVTLGDNVFTGISFNCILAVPDGTRDAYFAKGWTKDVFKGGVIEASASNDKPIVFEDDNVKTICLAKWDKNKDGELSEKEAAVVEDLGNTFQYNNSITSFKELIFFQYLTSILDYAFLGCNKLESIVIPKNVTSIGEHVFFNCDSLSSISVAGGNPVFDSRDNCNAIIETQSDKLVYGCNKTVIPSSVTSIGDYAFESIYSLTSIEIPNNVTSIGRGVFSGCKGLTSVVSKIEKPFTCDDSFWNIPNECILIVPDSTKNAYFAAGWTTDVFRGVLETSELSDEPIIFADATVKAICVEKWDKNKDGELSIKEAALVGDIGDSFQRNSKITSFDEFKFFTSVTTINYYSFQDCHSLTSIILPENVSSIRGWAFEYCSALTSIIIPNSVTEIGSAAFWHCESLSSVEIGSNVSSISSSMFSNCTNLTSISIPVSVTTIERGAFNGCNGLTSITIPNSVTTIEQSAFNGCNGLTSISIPNSVTLIEQSAFSGCTNIASMTVAIDNPIYDSRNNCNAIINTNSNSLLFGCKNTIIPNSVTSIGNYAFSYCSSLTSIVFPNSLTSIGEGAFKYCSGLTSIVFPSNIVSIGEEAFWCCSGLTSIDFPQNGSMTICGDAFHGCSGLTSINFSNGVKTIEGAFMDCYLSSIEISSSVTSITPGAFCDGDYLDYITVAEENPVYDSRYNCNAIIETESNTLMVGSNNTIIPNTVTSIGDFAFQSCWQMTSIDIPNSVISIGNYAFRGAGLTSIIIPESVETIGKEAFSYKNDLTDVYCYATNIPGTSQDAFKNLKLAVTLHVPEEAIEAYKSTAPWSDFPIIVPIQDTTPTSNIYFADENVKALCVSNWDKDGDGELSIAEAAGVTDLGDVFNGNRVITSFNELQYFTGLTTIGDEAFAWCSNLISVNIPNNVTTIGCGAFEYCNNLKTIVIPSNVSSVGSNAFINTYWYKQQGGIIYIGSVLYEYKGSMPQNTSVIVKDGTTSIEYSAFSGCTNLISIVIPNSVTSIENYAFFDCTNLASITFSEGLTYIGENAVINTAWFNNQPDGLVYINKIAYKYKGNMPDSTSITIKDGTIFIGERAFASRSELTSIIIPNSVTSIGNKAFMSCHGLKSIEIPNGVTSIGDYAFYLSDITSFTIPSSVTHMGTSAINDCKYLSYISVDENNPVFDSRENCNALIETSTNTIIQASNNAVIPNTVTKIGFASFADCYMMTSLVIPESVTRIEDYAFANKSITDYYLSHAIIPEVTSKTFYSVDLSKVRLHVPMEMIESYQSTEPWKDFGIITPLPTSIIAFADANVKALCVSNWDANSDGELTIAEAEAVSSIGNIFQDNKEITSFNELQYFTGLTAIDEDAFSGCTNMASIEIPGSITSVGKNAFSNTAWYDNQRNGLIYIGKAAYKYKGTMLSNTSITLMDGTVSICDEAFKGFRYLKSITLPESLTTIGDSAFYNTGLSSFTIPSSVIHIGKNALDGCTGLFSIVVNENNPVYDSRSNCRALIETSTNTLIKASGNTEIPGTVTKIGAAAFSDCIYMTSIDIPGSVTSIEDNSFANPNITDYYFYPAVIPDVTDNTFLNVDLSAVTLHVPLDIIESYESLAPWSSFGSIVPLATSIIRFADSNVKAICVSRWDTDGDGELSIAEAEAVTNFQAIDKKNITSFNELKYFTGLINIDNYAFSDCSALTSIVIPDNVTTIGQGLFSGCVNLKSIELSSSLSSVESYTFSDCRSLTSIVIPNSVTYIGRSAFYGCSSLTSNVISENINYISPDAFDGCNSLQSVYSLSMTPNSVSFSNMIYDNATLYVPEGCVEIYRNTDGWKQFKNILSFDPVGVKMIVADIDSDAVEYFDLSGKKLETLQNGVIIIRYSNGKTRKITLD